MTISARHLLVIDDEPHIGLVLRPFLEQLGYRVSVVRTLTEARNALRSKPAADGLLLDLHLPDGSGLDFLRDLRQQGGMARLPVLVLTAEGEDRVLREAHRLGAALVNKPFSPTKLTQRIAMMFGDNPETDEGAPGLARGRRFSPVGPVRVSCRSPRRNVPSSCCCSRSASICSVICATTLTAAEVFPHRTYKCATSMNRR